MVRGVVAVGLEPLLPPDPPPPLPPPKLHLPVRELQVVPTGQQPPVLSLQQFEPRAQAPLPSLQQVEVEDMQPPLQQRWMDKQ